MHKYTIPIPIQVILNDKAKIESVISELDIQKVQALHKTYTQVNRDFGSIFSMLLPGMYRCRMLMLYGVWYKVCMV
ncbi:hypothetical protein EON63_14295 [archaeon]|nr:MAG: hypothetical protein EON63_14295 [archaeon]